jgi:hypothetical protein
MKVGVIGVRPRLSSSFPKWLLWECRRKWGNSVARLGQSGFNPYAKNSVDMEIRFGMGVPMNSNNTQCAAGQCSPRRGALTPQRQEPQSPIKKTPADRPEFPSLPEKRHEPESAAPRKWQNLTLDDLQNWMDEANHREAERNKSTRPS